MNEGEWEVVQDAFDEYDRKHNWLVRYKQWVDEMVNRPESLQKAREHAPSRTLKRNP